MLKKFLIVLLSWSMLFVPLFAQNAENTCAQAQLDAQTDVNSNLWFGAGCLFGLIGWGAAYVIEANPPATRMLGKSPEYVALYSDCYRAEAKTIQTKKALNGCLIGACVSVVFQVMVLSAAASETTIE